MEKARYGHFAIPGDDDDLFVYGGWERVSKYWRAPGPYGVEKTYYDSQSISSVERFTEVGGWQRLPSTKHERKYVSNLFLEFCVVLTFSRPTAVSFDRTLYCLISFAYNSY